MKFNPAPSTVMHIDINSCFATIEQQANPFLRGKPVAVAAYDSPNGCILAPSIEAKRFGVKTGMRVRDGKLFCPNLLVLSPDPWKYRIVHLQMRKIFAKYTNNFSPKSIDEFVLDLANYPAFDLGLLNIAREIKQKIRDEIGEYIRVSIGIAPNRFLAKVAAGVKKPDGLIEINKDNFLDVYANLELVDLYGIATRFAARLEGVGISNVIEFYNAPLWKLKAAFASVGSHYWFMRLRGWEIDDAAFARRTYGNSYSLPSRQAGLPKPFATRQELGPILCKLVEKSSYRLRRAGYKAFGVHLAVRFRDRSFWHKGVSSDEELYDTRIMYRRAYELLSQAPLPNPVANLAISWFRIVKSKSAQLGLFDDILKRQQATKAADSINKRWGDFVISSARMADTREFVPDRIAFGNVKELEEFSSLAR